MPPKPISFVAHSVNFTPPQLKTVTTGGSVLLKPAQFAVDGEHQISAMPSTSKKILSSVQKGKGFRFKLKKKEAILDKEGGAIDWKALGNKFKSTVSTIASAIPDSVKQEAINTAKTAIENIVLKKSGGRIRKVRGGKLAINAVPVDEVVPPPPPTPPPTPSAPRKKRGGCIRSTCKMINIHPDAFKSAIELQGGCVMNKSQFLSDLDTAHSQITGKGINWGALGDSIKHGFQSVGNFLAPIAKDFVHAAAPIAIPALSAVAGGMATAAFENPELGLAAAAGTNAALSGAVKRMGNGLSGIRAAPSHAICLGSNIAHIQSPQMNPFVGHNQSHSDNPVRKHGGCVIARGLYPASAPDAGMGLYAAGQSAATRS